MGAKPLMNKARSLKSAISGGLVAVLVAGMGAIGTTPAQATPATINVTVSCSANTDFIASYGDTVVFSFGSDCTNVSQFFTWNTWMQAGPYLTPSSNGAVATAGPLTKTVDANGFNVVFPQTVAYIIPNVNSFAEQTSPKIRWVGAPSVAPTISTQPVSASKTAGDSLSLSVSATVTGGGVLTYRWKKDGVSLSGMTSDSLSIPNVAAGDAGSYTVDVTNTEAPNLPTTVTSSAAVVTVAAAASTPTTPSVSAPSTATNTPAVAPKAAIEFKIPEGKPVAAAPVDVEVEGLKDQSSYTITVRSTPIIVDQGTIYNSRLKTSIKIPSGLTPGWHSITVDATAADGTPWNEVMYFEVSASGLLKSTSDVRTSNPGAIAFSAGTSSLSSATKNSIKATVKEAGKSAKYTITGTAGKKSGVSDKAVKALAKKRANILKAYLVKLGVSKSSITIKTKVVKQGKKPKASVLALY